MLAFKLDFPWSSSVTQPHHYLQWKAGSRGLTHFADIVLNKLQKQQETALLYLSDWVSLVQQDLGAVQGKHWITMISSHSEDMGQMVWQMRFCRIKGHCFQTRSGLGKEMVQAVTLSASRRSSNTRVCSARFDFLIFCIAEFITIHHQMRSLMFTRILCYKNPRSIE